jgi:FemAB family protein
MNNIDKLSEFIHELFSKSRLEFEFHKLSIDRGPAYYNCYKNFFSNKKITFRYSLFWLEYLNSYFSEKNVNSLSSLYVFISKGEVIGYWPLTISYDDDGFSLTTFGYSIFEPFFTNPLENKFLIEKCAILLLDIKKSNLFSRIDVLSNLYSGSPLNKFWDVLLSQGSIYQYFSYDLDIDLTLDLSEIKSCFRKSYKSIVNRNYENLTYVIYDSKNITIDYWLEIKNLHHHVSGRQTRSDNTWNLQYEMIRKGYAFSTAIYNNKKIIGAALFGVSKLDAYYFIGAYERDMSNLNLGHQSIYMAIKKSKEMNVKKLNLGSLSVPSIYNKLSDKELAIEQFKKGFATSFNGITTFGLIK